MCANYVPVTRSDRLLEYFGVRRDPGDDVERDVFPMGFGPFIRRADADGSHNAARVIDDGIFRFVPDFVSRVDWARKTYNARSETVTSKVTYRAAWDAGQRCIIPAEAIYEPNYESGSAVRWRIRHGSGEPMGIAGIYRTWTDADGELVFSMSMLTVNADDHPFMNRFHAPNEEKRMVVVLDPKDFEGWLTCAVEEARPRYCKQWTGPLVGEPAPLPQRSKAPRPSSTRGAIDGSTGDLF